MIKTLITEDDFRIADIHKEFLETIDGVEVVGKALNGKETLSLIRKHSPDLLLLDIYLPDYLGIDLIPEIRNIYPDIDIIVITAAKESYLLEKSLRKGIVNYLIKPVSLERLKSVINDYREQKEIFRQNESVDQEMVNYILHSSKRKEQKNAELPKGIDSITLEKVKSLMEKDKNSWSAEDMGDQIGSSRTTARRYLEYLVSVGYAQVQQEYGVIGRPQRRYSLIKTRQEQG